MTRAAVFDAYGTLFDVHSLAAACESAFPGRGDAINRLWRQKQLEYSWLRTAMGRYRDFWGITRDARRWPVGRSDARTSAPGTVSRARRLDSVVTCYCVAASTALRP